MNEIQEINAPVMSEGGAIVRSKKWRFTGAAVMAISLAAISPTHAEERGSEIGRVADGDIIVTAQRRAQSLKDVPVAVSVVSGEMLDQANIKSLEDMAARMPSVRVTSGTITNSIAIRGVASGANGGFEQSVATFVDGVYRNRSRSTRGAMFDIERVEVLKGPQTTFFGANAIAGALNISTRKPGDDFDYNASAFYTPATGEYNLEAGVDVPAGETFAARVAARVSGSEGYVHNDVTGEDGPHDRSVQGRLSLRWEPSASFRSDLRVEGSRSRTQNAMPLQLLNCAPDAAFTMAPTNTCRGYLNRSGGVVDDRLDYHTSTGKNFSNFDYVETAWSNSLDLGGGTLNSITGYQWQDFTTQGGSMPFPMPAVGGGDVGFPTYQNEKYRQFSQEIRFQSETGGAFEYMVGAYAAWGKLDFQGLVGFRFAPFGGFNPTGTTNAATPISSEIGVDQKDRTLSTFAAATIRPVTGMRINLGARYSNVRKTVTRFASMGSADPYVTPGSYVVFDPATQTIIAGILGANIAPFVNPRRTDDKFMPSVSVQYDVTPDVMVYASYANGFKAGGYSTGANNNEFGPESVDAYEIGLKGRFLDRRLTFDLALYRSDYTDLQETALQILTSGAVTSVVGNAAGSRAQGVELSTSFRFAPWFTLAADVAYTDSKYTDYTDAACTIYGLYLSSTCVQDMSGKRRSYAPKWSGNVSAHIVAPLGGGNRLTIDPLMYFSSATYLSATADPLLEQKSYTKYDLRVGIGPDTGRWELAIVGKNLSNRKTAMFRQAVVGAPGSVGALIDPPRTVGIQFTIRK